MFSLRDAWEKFDVTGEFTIRDLVNEVDKLVSDGKSPEELRKHVNAFRMAEQEDRELAGRGDIDAAEESFCEAVRKAIP
jgi:hypothetical protein